MPPLITLSPPPFPARRRHMWTTLPVFQADVNNMLKRLEGGDANQGPGVDGGQADVLAGGAADGGGQEGGGQAAGGGGKGRKARKPRRRGPKLQPALDGPYNPTEDDAFSTLIQVWAPSMGMVPHGGRFCISSGLSI